MLSHIISDVITAIQLAVNVCETKHLQNYYSVRINVKLPSKAKCGVPVSVIFIYLTLKIK